MRSVSLSRPTALAVAISLCALASNAHAGDPPPGQPYASYWFPSTILDWDPATDPDAPFNRGSIPLATRFTDPASNVNPHAHVDEGRVQSLVAFAPTSFNPSQGAPVMDYYALNYWQYLDQLVFWGGSAGEGLILAPNPTVIDAAHRNGVPVLGNVYLPPTAFGGQIQWVHDFVQRDGDTFPVADKMIEAAEYYGFDGWFINQETAGGDATLANDMRDMLEYFHAHSNLTITWYDAMTASGAVNWQNALTAQNQMFFQDGDTLVSDRMFLNFNWNTARLASSSTLATNLGRSPYDLYAGIDVESNGFNTSVGWAAVFPEGQPHVTSIGFYRPEWTHNSSTSVANFYARDNKFWVGQNGDPSNTTTSSNWKGVANYIPANSPITASPFVTNFNTGQGNHYALDGQVVATDEWNNLSVQDVLPTWRWIMRSDGASTLTPSLDFDEAYWGGTSLKVSGTLDGTNDLMLYETDIPVSVDTNVMLAYKTGVAGASHMQVALAFEDTPGVYETIDAGDAGDGWTTATLPLSLYAGRRIGVIGLRFVADADAASYTVNVGRLGVYEAPLFKPAPPSDVTVMQFNPIDEDDATVRLTWTASSNTVNSYNVLQQHPDGSATWLGATPNTAYFVGNLRRDPGAATSTITVESVTPEFSRSLPAAVTVTWPVSDVIFADGFDGAN